MGVFRTCLVSVQVSRDRNHLGGGAIRGAVKKITFLADMSVKGGGEENFCPLRKCKFLLWEEEKN